MKGRRIYPDENGWLRQAFDPGDYGCAKPLRMADGSPLGAEWPSYWQLMAPNGHSCSLDPKIHTVVEHEDGSITVSPSIRFLNQGGLDWWHGFLERGVWREA